MASSARSSTMAPASLSKPGLRRLTHTGAPRHLALKTSPKAPLAIGSFAMVRAEGSISHSCGRRNDVCAAAVTVRKLMRTRATTEAADFMAAAAALGRFWARPSAGAGRAAPAGARAREQGV